MCPRVTCPPLERCVMPAVRFQLWLKVCGYHLLLLVFNKSKRMCTLSHWMTFEKITFQLLSEV